MAKKGNQGSSEEENDTRVSWLGMHRFPRSDEEQKALEKADPETKQEMRRNFREREQSQCHEPSCDNSAVHHPGWSLFGWCIGHNPDDDKED